MLCRSICDALETPLIFPVARWLSRLFRQQMADYEKRLEKGKADEAMMLRALQEIRHKTLEDERQFNAAAQLVKVTRGCCCLLS